jgi:hypothetical protein
MLTNLQFTAVRRRFGMFFLLNLERVSGAVQGIVSGTLDDITTDDETVSFIMGARSRRKQRKQPELLVPQTATPEYPIGPNPSWQTIITTLAQHPQTLLREPLWDPTFNNHELAGELFILFTMDYWMTSSENFLIGQPVKPANVQEAMEAWSVKHIMHAFIDPSIVPVKNHWQGIPKGHREQTFQERMPLFFPHPDEADSPDKNSAWAVLWKEGYIHQYHSKLGEMDEGEEAGLHNALASIFGKLQCLPAMTGSSKHNGKLWIMNASKTGPKWVANPLLYMIASVGHGPQNAPRLAKRLVAPNRQIAARLKAAHQGIPENLAMQRQKQQQRAKNNTRSAKARNKRKPPQKNKNKRPFTQKKQASEESDQDTSSELEATQHLPLYKNSGKLANDTSHQNHHGLFHRAPPKECVADKNKSSEKEELSLSTSEDSTFSFDMTTSEEDDDNDD